MRFESAPGEWGAFWLQSPTMGNPVGDVGAAPLQGGWHTYAVHWTDQGYAFYLDGVQQWASALGLSRRPEFIKVTCEVQNRSWAGAIPAGGYGTREASGTRMQLDWVRVWQPAP